jgi:hypothetical protein
MKHSQQIKYPYARLTGLTRFMDILRNDPEWKPDVINIDLLQTLGIAPSKERETFYTLKFLGIIGTDGAPTEEFDNLRNDYQGTMKRLVSEKYRELFKQIPSRMISQIPLVRFFGLSPDTSEYQAKLFAWLCEQAGIELPNLEKNFHRSRFDKSHDNGHST